VKWFKKVVFLNYANFKGRAQRKEYFMFVLFYSLFILLALIADIVVFDYDLDDAEGYGLFFSIFLLAMMMPGTAVTARRLHDVGKSGWLQLILLIPLIGPIVLLVFLCKDGVPQANKYGTSPKCIPLSTQVEYLKSQNIV
jgi:uncharacterized membrane protein YhaH (DUF805 family)